MVLIKQVHLFGAKWGMLAGRPLNMLETNATLNTVLLLMALRYGMGPLPGMKSAR